ncbi:MAG: ACT domain-containing protein [Deltaproteobacteria bacterium HGW-Deltaproteobacteria-14]|jgi:hypothetical protein|nr:MAG: ACT domain-containing protein [Deltaproteobacteria bacterium HGW-Deltaproteobacteria-14]
MLTDDTARTPPARLKLRVLPGRFAVCRLDAAHPIPGWFRPGPLAAITYTDDELSLVVPDEDVPEGVTAARGWRAFMVLGPLEFSLTGVLASLAAPLAEAHISLFALSTFETDYILVRAKDLDAARAAVAGRFDWTN